jgi:hypothetical protein
VASNHRDQPTYAIGTSVPANLQPLASKGSNELHRADQGAAGLPYADEVLFGAKTRTVEL